MFGNFFEGQRCADSCVKYKGKIIPDCEDIGMLKNFKLIIHNNQSIIYSLTIPLESISPFLNTKV